LSRVRKRYLLIRVYPREVDVTPAELKRTIVDELLGLGGLLSLAESDISVKRTRLQGGEYILRCGLRSLPVVLLSTAMVRQLGGKKARLDIVKISGTLKGLTS